MGQHAQGERGLNQASIRDEAASPAGAAATRPVSLKRVPWALCSEEPAEGGPAVGHARHARHAEAGPGPG